MVSIEEEMMKLEEVTGYYCHNAVLPRVAEKYDELVCDDYDELGIVIQGPLKREDEFTLETVRLYKKWYPNVTVIVSTWKNEDADVIRQMEECGAIVIQGDLPSNSGILNINYQLTSSINGIRKAKELNLEYVLKTRSDQRLTMNNFVEILMHFLELYPTDFPEYQKGRIITPYFVPHIIGFLSDFMEFGYTCDMEKYFGAELQSLTYKQVIDSSNATHILDNSFGKCTAQKMFGNAEIFDNDKTFNDLNSECIFPEVYLGKSYMVNVLHLEPSLTNYMKYLSGGIVCADMKMLGLYWRKDIFKSVGKYNKGLASGLRYEAMYGDWLWLFRRCGV